MLRLLRYILSFFTYEPNEDNYLKVGEQFIGKLQNEYKDHIITITEDMVDNDESTIHFLHYYGFEEYKP